MTIPTQHNCPHSPDGWCLACVETLASENERLRRVEEAARHYRFGGTKAGRDFLTRRGWKENLFGKWAAPEGYPCDEPKPLLVSLAVELEMALGLHK